jgi:tetratricopeptide (TPR) repeat protein
MKTLYGERDYTFGQLMLTLRNKMGLTQEQLGECVGVSWRSVSDWETGTSYPKAERLKAFIVLAVKTRAFVEGSEAEAIRALWNAARQKALLDEHWLSLLLSEPPSQEELQVAPPQRAENETDALLHDEDQRAPKIQNLPFPRNPFFTGRESELLMMAHLFEQNERIALTQPISISGLGGIGKTQLALEYAHRSYPGIYRSVLWVNAADKASLEASYLTLAHLLKLPSDNEREIDRIVEAIKIWLEEHSRWLLILDNVDNLELARSYLPTRPRGHILFTTRSQIVGDMAALIQVETMSREVGLLFLLRRSGVLKSGAQAGRIASDIRCEAEALVEMLAGHPLALDQAGAYIEETGEACFTEYRQLYQQQSRSLLKRRGDLGGKHPESVATTFEISLQKACKLHPSCADILAFCSLLHPDTIPEELLRQGLNLDLLLFNEVIRALRSYSLIKRDAKKQVLSLHRLVQAVIRDGMDKQTMNRWTERVVRAVNAAFPEATFEEWPRCEQLLPHVQVCATWIEREVVAPAEAAHLLRKAGDYLWRRGQYADAEPLHKLALAICEQHLGAEHPDTAMSLNNLALLCQDQGKYEQAELLHQRALTIFEQHLGAEHPNTAMSLNNLANFCQDQGKYEQAEPLYQRALSIYEQHLGAEHPDIARSLNNLGCLYRDQGKYEQAEPLYQRALSIREQHLGAEHPNTAQCLNNLATLYWYQGIYEQAESLYQRALAIYEQHVGTEHSDIAQCLNNLAIIYKEQGKYEQAEPLYQRALSIWERHLGTEHPHTAACLNNLAELYLRQGKYEQAEPMYQRALSIWEHRLGAEHPYMAEALHGLAELYQQQGKYEQAEPLYQRALHIREQRLGLAHPETQEIQKAYAAFLRLVERDEKGTVLDVDHQPSAEEEG